MDWNEGKFEEKLQKSLNSLIHSLSGIRAGNATTGLIENVFVDAYNQKMKLIQIAAIDVSGNRELTVRPFDMSLCDAIQKGIQIANLGLTCSFDGSGVIIRIPVLTEEVRKDLVKNVEKILEDTKVSMRNIRRDEIEILKTAQKAKEISEDVLRRNTDKIQKILDKSIEKADAETNKKKKALLGHK